MIDLANPANWLTIYEAQTVHVGGAPLPPIWIDGSYDHRYLRVTAGNEYPKPNWKLGAYIDLMVDGSTPETRAYRFEPDINEATLLVVPDFLASYKIRAIAPKWFRCIELKIEVFEVQITSYTYFGDYAPTDIYNFGLEIGNRFVFSQSGQITKLRFYKPESETGTHTLKLWDSQTEELITSVETSSTVTGWLEVELVSPVAIAIGDILVVSVNTNNDFSILSGTNPIDNPSSPIQLYNQNSIYTVNSGSFPTSGGNDGDFYFVDVVFETT